MNKRELSKVLRESADSPILLNVVRDVTPDYLIRRALEELTLLNNTMEADYVPQESTYMSGRLRDTITFLGLARLKLGTTQAENQG